MLPVVVLVGRPNVGKSTLFNRLTGTRDALVADMPPKAMRAPRMTPCALSKRMAPQTAEMS